jgi:hypothetical protein
VGSNFKVISAIGHVLRSSSDILRHSFTVLLGPAELRILGRFSSFMKCSPQHYRFVISVLKQSSAPALPGSLEERNEWLDPQCRDEHA